MTTDVRPIETEYAGCRFRSRLEARWAVVLDAKGMTWEYEPEGFETPCGRYLPDFRVALWPGPDPERIWLEIKPDGYELQDEDLGRWICLSRDSKMRVVAACGLDSMTILVTHGKTYAHAGYPGFFDAEVIARGRMARFEFGERG
jgi:hypothetical protein